MGCEGGVALKRLGGDRAGEVALGRFLRHAGVTPDEMVRTAAAGTRARASGRPVLAIQDTTSLRDASNTTRRSLHLHATIAVDAEDGALLGLVGATFLHRSGGRRASRGTRAFADKESRRWLDATRQAADLAEAGADAGPEAGAGAGAGASRVTVVADREGDVWEELALRPSAVDLVIRAQQDRTLADGTLLSRCLDDVAELGREVVDLPAHAGRPARRAVLALRAREVRLRAPDRVRAQVKAGTVPGEVALWLVQACEVEPPADGTAAHWLLLTTRPVPDAAAARQVTGIYRQRWIIEQLFRTMKTKGFDIEASQVEQGGPFENLCAAVLVAAVAVLQMVRERDGAAGRPASDVFEPQHQQVMQAVNASVERKTARQKNPHPPHTLAWATWICARLGGWNAYYGKPGPITLHRGLLQLQTIIKGWCLRQNM